MISYYELLGLIKDGNPPKKLNLMKVFLNGMVLVILMKTMIIAKDF